MPDSQASGTCKQSQLRCLGKAPPVEGSLCLLSPTSTWQSGPVQGFLSRWPPRTFARSFSSNTKAFDWRHHGPLVTPFIADTHQSCWSICWWGERLARTRCHTRSRLDHFVISCVKSNTSFQTSFGRHMDNYLSRCTGLIVWAAFLQKAKVTPIMADTSQSFWSCC